MEILGLPNLKWDYGGQRDNISSDPVAASDWKVGGGP